MKTSIYIAGPMTGLPDFNYPAFHKAKEILEAKGFIVRSPADVPIQDSVEDYMRIDIPLLCSCNCTLFLPGWENSKGANIERLISIAIGNQLYKMIDDEIFMDE